MERRKWFFFCSILGLQLSEYEGPLGTWESCNQAKTLRKRICAPVRAAVHRAFETKKS